MGNKQVLVLASSFLDTPVSTDGGDSDGKVILDAFAADTGVEVVYRCDRSPLEALRPEELDGVAAVIADLENYPADLLERVGVGAGGSLELIARYGVGLSSVDVAAATRCGVLVSNTPGANTGPTAEWAVSTLLDIAGRRLTHQERAAQGLLKEGPPRLDVAGKVLGIVGTGAIGRRVAALLAGFDLQLLGYDPHPNTPWANGAGADYVSLDELLERADFVTLHAAVSTRLIGAEEIARMKRHAVLVNCARGVLVDGRAAYRAVAEGHLWGYGLDEVWEYPDLPLDGLNIAVSPHVGSDTDGGKRGMQTLSAGAVVEYLSGKRPVHAANPEVFDR